MRLDQLSESSVTNELQALRRSLDEMKASSQVVSGGNVRSFVSESGGAYDWSGVLATDPSAGPGFGLRRLRVTATATTMDSLFGDLIVKLYVGSMSTWYRPNNMLADLDAGNPPWSARFFDGTVDVNNQRVKRWYIQVLGNDSTTAYVKVQVVASDAVTVLVEAIS